MSKQDLKSLLETYRFLDTALVRHAKAMRTDDRAALGGELATSFSRLLTEPTDSEQITHRQVRMLLECLRSTPDDPEVSRFVAEACLRHLGRLEATCAGGKGRARGQAMTVDEIAPRADLPAARATCGALDLSRFKVLDLSSDRIALIGADYRYLYCNVANARFHACSPDAILGKPVWVTTSEQFFRDISRPSIDRCLAGKSVEFRAAHPGRDPNATYSARLDPVRDSQGRIVAVLGSARLIAE